MKHNYEFKEKRISIKPLFKDNIENLRELRNRNENRLKFVYSGIVTEDQQQSWYKSYLIKSDDYMFSVFLNTNSDWIGAVAIYDIDISNSTAEFGRIVLDKNKCKNEKGLGVEVTKAACDIAFTKLGVKKIKLEVFIDNIPAIKTYERAGFKITGETQTENGQKMYLMELCK